MTIHEDIEVLRPTLWSSLSLLALSSVFVAGGVFIIPSNLWLGLLGTGFFSLGILVSLVQLLPGSSYLRIDDEGFTTCAMFRETRISWAAVADFGIVTIGHNKRVGMRFEESYDRSRGLRKVASALSGCEGSLCDNYGMRPEQLADKLTARLEKYRERQSANKERRVP